MNGVGPEARVPGGNAGGKSGEGGALSLAPLRVGSVAALNAAPLTFGAEEQVVFAPPSSLAGLLRAGALDAALVSSIEVLRSPDYEVLDGLGIVSDGPVYSVLLGHTRPLEELEEIHCDTASLTSVGLLRVLLAERGLRPRLAPLPDYATAHDREAVLLIGDTAMAFQQATGPHRIWDLGEAWRELTGLPFVYAVWALRRGATTPEWRARLRRVGEQGLARREELLLRCPPEERELLRRYLTENIRYRLGPAEKAGLARFRDLLEKHTGERLHLPVYVD